MKKEALNYLNKNRLLNIGIIEPIRRKTANIIYAQNQGVMIFEKESQSYMLSVDDLETGKKLINSINDIRLLALHQDYMADYVKKNYNFSHILECYQAVYLDSKISIDDNSMDIKPLNHKDKSIITENYKSLTDEELKKLLDKKSLLGGYVNNNLVGFIGNHLEGSMGILEIFPEYRRKGYAYILESYLIEKMLSKGLVPFAQIEVTNIKSIELHKKLNFNISKEKLFWFF